MSTEDTKGPDKGANKQEVIDFFNKNRIKKTELEDYRIGPLLKLFEAMSLCTSFSAVRLYSFDDIYVASGRSCCNSLPT